MSIAVQNTISGIVKPYRPLSSPYTCVVESVFTLPDVDDSDSLSFTNLADLVLVSADEWMALSHEHISVLMFDGRLSHCRVLELRADDEVRRHVASSSDSNGLKIDEPCISQPLSSIARIMHVSLASDEDVTVDIDCADAWYALGHGQVLCAWSPIEENGLRQHSPPVRSTLSLRKNDNQHDQIGEKYVVILSNVAVDTDKLHERNVYLTTSTAQGLILFHNSLTWSLNPTAIKCQAESANRVSNTSLWNAPRDSYGGLPSVCVISNRDAERTTNLALPMVVVIDLSQPLLPFRCLTSYDLSEDKLLHGDTVVPYGPMVDMCLGIETSHGCNDTREQKMLELCEILEYDWPISLPKRSNDIQGSSHTGLLKGWRLSHTYVKPRVGYVVHSDQVVLKDGKAHHNLYRRNIAHVKKIYCEQVDMTYNVPLYITDGPHAINANGVTGLFLCVGVTREDPTMEDIYVLDCSAMQPESGSDRSSNDDSCQFYSRDLAVWSRLSRDTSNNDKSTNFCRNVNVLERLRYVPAANVLLRFQFRVRKHYLIGGSEYTQGGTWILCAVERIRVTCCSDSTADLLKSISQHGVEITESPLTEKCATHPYYSVAALRSLLYEPI